MQPDIELNVLTGKEDSLAQGSTWSMRDGGYDAPGRRRGPVSPFGRWVEGFRRDPNSRAKRADHRRDGMGGPMDRRSSAASGEHRRGAHYFDLHAANLGTANTMLSRELKGRHLQMIAIGGSIGERLFPLSPTPSLDSLWMKNPIVLH